MTDRRAECRNGVRFRTGDCLEGELPNQLEPNGEPECIVADDVPDLGGIGGEGCDGKGPLRALGESGYELVVYVASLHV